MNIGIITFHWATNYGAVLQAYALQEKLSQEGHKASIINYYPARYKKNYFNAVLTRHIKQIPKRLSEIKKERKIALFREKYLNATKYYSTSAKLKKANFLYDAYICGSDQIWNESFTSKGERKKTFSYFLDFAPKQKIIASYAASFGTTKYNEGLKPYIKEKLERFDFISVREETGADIVEALGLMRPYVVPDPTLLLNKADYEKFIVNRKKNERYIYSYMLHSKKYDVDFILSDMGLKVIEAKNETVEEWLSNIYYSEFVITNSFHGMVFSIILKKPFAVILLDGSGMNDRILTLLKKLGLENRIAKKGEVFCDMMIDWEAVNENMKKYQYLGEEYINKIFDCKK